MRSPCHAATLARRLFWLLPLFALLGLTLAVQARAFWPFSEAAGTETCPTAASAEADAMALEANIQDLTRQMLTHLGEPDPQAGQLSDGLVVCSLSS